MALIIEFLVRWILKGELRLISRVAGFLRKKPNQFFSELFTKPYQTAKEIANLPQKYKNEIVNLVNLPQQAKVKLENLQTPKGFSNYLKQQGRKVGKQTEPNFADFLGKLSQAERRQYGQTRATKNTFKEFAILSSSWVLDGFFSSVQDSNTGTLDLEFKDAKHIYTYYEVPRSVWEAMKNARGRDGSGAGSVFWALFLRGYHSSFDSVRLPELYKKAGITENPVPNPKRMRGVKRVKLGKGISQKQVVLTAKEKWFFKRSNQNKSTILRMKRALAKKRVKRTSGRLRRVGDILNKQLTKWDKQRGKA